MMYFGDHPPPHVHARVGRPRTPGAEEARFSIATGELIDGYLPTVLSGQVTSWCRSNRQSLVADWARAQADQHPTSRYD